VVEGEEFESLSSLTAVPCPSSASRSPVPHRGLQPLPPEFVESERKRSIHAVMFARIFLTVARGICGRAACERTSYGGESRSGAPS